jgi:hypothetical protein
MESIIFRDLTKMCILAYAFTIENAEILAGIAAIG